MDGLVVCLKMIQDQKKLKQIKIIEYFASRRMIEDSRNHVVPFYATFSDHESPDIQFLVMPVLRRFDDPEFMFGSEVIDFVTQVLEVCCVVMCIVHDSNPDYEGIGVSSRQ